MAALFANKIVQNVRKMDVVCAMMQNTVSILIILIGSD